MSPPIEKEQMPDGLVQSSAAPDTAVESRSRSASVRWVTEPARPDTI